MKCLALSRFIFCKTMSIPVPTGFPWKHGKREFPIPMQTYTLRPLTHVPETVAITSTPVPVFHANAHLGLWRRFLEPVFEACVRGLCIRIILSDFVRFWCISCMVSFRRRVRITGGQGLVCCMQLS